MAARQISSYLTADLLAGTRRTTYWITVALFSAVAVPLLWGYSGTAAMTWMYVYHPSDVTSWAELVDYIAGLRVPIPVLISITEIADYQLFGDLFLSSRVAYPASIFFGFAFALWLASTSRLRLAAAFVLSLVYVWGLRIVHFGNPQTYDVIFPALVLLYAVLLEQARRGEAGDRWAAAAAVGAGFALSATELTRPYIIFLLPCLLIAAVLFLRPTGWRRIALFLMPVAILSGGWHLHIANSQEQLVWSNHSGFNLQRSWSMVPMPPLVEEVDSAPLAPDRWPNLNTPEHSENSRRIQAAVIAFIRENPGESAIHILRRLETFLAVPTGFYSWQPDNPGLRYYRWAVWAGLAWLVAQSLPAVKALFRGDWRAFITPESQIIAVTVVSILILAIAEQGEEARMWVSILPLLAVLPNIRNSDG